MLLVKGYIIDAFDIKGIVARRQAVDDPMDGGRLDLWSEGALVEEASFQPPRADFQVDAEVPRVVCILGCRKRRPGFICPRGLVFTNDGKFPTVFLRRWEESARFAQCLSLVVSNDGLGSCDALVWQDVLGEAVLDHARAEPKQARVHFLIGAEENAIPLARADEDSRVCFWRDGDAVDLCDGELEVLVDADFEPTKAAHIDDSEPVAFVRGEVECG